MNKQASGKALTQRQLRVGEQVRHILSDIFRDLDFYNAPALRGVSVTVSEVRVSPDMHNATVYVLPLGREPDAEFESALNDISPQLRHDMARELRMKYTPKLYFKFDHSFAEASKMDELLYQAHKKDATESV